MNLKQKKELEDALKELFDDSKDPLVVCVQPLNEDETPAGPLITTKGELQVAFTKKPK